MPYNVNNGSYYNWTPQQTPMYQQNTSWGGNQMYGAAQPSMPIGIIWVDGEIGAKAYQVPTNWPSGVPIPLWDSNDQVIYLKSMNQVGMPNPLQKIRYTIEEQPLLPAVSNASGESSENKYVTKADLETLKNELREMLRNNRSGNQNGNNQNGNRGGDR